MTITTYDKLYGAPTADEALAHVEHVDRFLDHETGSKMTACGLFVFRDLLRRVLQIAHSGIPRRAEERP